MFILKLVTMAVKLGLGLLKLLIEVVGLITIVVFAFVLKELFSSH